MLSRLTGAGTNQANQNFYQTDSLMTDSPRAGKHHIADPKIHGDVYFLFHLFHFSLERV